MTFFSNQIFLNYRSKTNVAHFIKDLSQLSTVVSAAPLSSEVASQETDAVAQWIERDLESRQPELLFAVR